MKAKANFGGSIFGIANNISLELKDIYPTCTFRYVCQPPDYISVSLVRSNMDLLNLEYLPGILGQSLEDTDRLRARHTKLTNGSKPELLSREALRLINQIQVLLESSGGEHMYKIGKTEVPPTFWYSGPFFDKNLLLENAWDVGGFAGLSSDDVDELWNGHLARRDWTPHASSVSEL